jgi:hypothetical protein
MLEHEKGLLSSSIYLRYLCAYPIQKLRELPPRPMRRCFSRTFAGEFPAANQGLKAEKAAQNNAILY